MSFWLHFQNVSSTVSTRTGLERSQKFKKKIQKIKKHHSSFISSQTKLGAFSKKFKKNSKKKSFRVPFCLTRV